MNGQNDTKRLCYTPFQQVKEAFNDSYLFLIASVKITFKTPSVIMFKVMLQHDRKLF